MAIDPRVLKHFKANLNFFCNWHTLTGKTWKESCLGWGKTAPPDEDARIILFAGMKDEISGLTVIECGKMIDVANSVESWTYIYRTIANSQGADLKNQAQSPSGPSDGPSPGSPSDSEGMKQDG
jgi:hypothetical protein